jgi:hypothetical protein
VASDRGLLNLIKTNNEAKKIVQKFRALALLPADRIVEAYLLLREEAELFDEFLPFLEYFYSFWIKKSIYSFDTHLEILIIKLYFFCLFQMRAVFYVYGLDHRTNNSVESFHGNIKRSLSIVVYGSLFVSLFYKYFT